MDIRSFNRDAWDHQVEKGNRWTVPVDSKVIAEARKGEWQILLTPTIPTPRHWFPPLEGTKVLCLASGGGQQGPVLAAAGADVTVFDNSPRQLAQDALVAARENLKINLVEGDMRDLSVFPDESFDLIFHPVSNVFIPDVQPVWREAYRVLRPTGALLAGFTNPLMYMFDFELMDEQGILEIKHSIPYSDLESLSEEKKKQYQAEGWPMEFSHTLDELIGGQLQAGFTLTGFYEDSDPNELLHHYIPTYFATCAVKPKPKSAIPDEQNGKSRAESTLLDTAQFELSIADNSIENDLPVGATNDFAFRLLQALTTQSRSDNVFFSAYSIAAALAMTANGARGKTLEAIHATLGLNRFSKEEINRRFAALYKSLNTGDHRLQLKIANSLWGRDGLEFKSAFLHVCRRFFDAEIQELDLSSPEALLTINDWGERKTEGKLTNLVKESDLGPLTVMVLINAIYFKGDWQRQFDPRHTLPGIFHLADGSEATCQMMSMQNAEFPYLRAPNFQAIALPYGEGQFSFYAFLPDRTVSLAEFRGQLRAAEWRQWFSQFEENKLDLKLPRFNLEYEVELKDALERLGMGIAFSDQADFFDLCNENAVITTVRHKAFLLVDEEGSEATAATAVIAARGAIPRPRLVFDRPFFFMICENKTGAVLFMGEVNKPQFRD